MINKTEQLIKEALESCKFRGHKMTEFKEASFGNQFFHSRCETCGFYAVVEPNPMPNSTTISGKAVAVHCQ